MIRARLGRWEKLSGGNWQPRQDLVAGLVPRASRVGDADLARAVREREGVITKRALDLAEQAVRSGAPWAKVFGPPPPARPLPRPGGTPWSSSPPTATAGISAP